jgi:hypothetical protein
LIIAARTRAALAAKRRRNERISRFAPFGYQIGADACMLESCAPERHVLLLIQKSRANGCSLQVIADELNRAGLRTRADSPWRYQNMQTPLKAA